MMCLRCFRCCVSIPAVHADGDLPGKTRINLADVVSIPAVHADGDLVNVTEMLTDFLVSIPAVHADGAPDLLAQRVGQVEFQSPPSTRTATVQGEARTLLHHVSIPAVHADGDPSDIPALLVPFLVSIPAVHADGD